MENKYIGKIKQMVIDCFKSDDVKIVLFGSRARKDNRICSDVDIGILPGRKIDTDETTRKITLLKEKMENLNIPYKVEIVNLQETSKVFKRHVLKEAVVWKDWS